MNVYMNIGLWTILPILAFVIILVLFVIYAVKKRLKLEKKFNDENEKAIGLMIKMKVPDHIKELAKLRDTGILSEEEFQIKKADLLKRL